jgi:hypothetical protein
MASFDPCLTTGTTCGSRRWFRSRSDVSYIWRVTQERTVTLNVSPPVTYLPSSENPRARLLKSHTPAHRARQLEDYYREAIAIGARTRPAAEVVA